MSGFYEPSGTSSASDAIDYWSKQVVMSFSSTSARDTALSGELRAGMVCTTTDTPQRMWRYSGSAWVCLWSETVDWSASAAFSSGVTEVDGTWNASYKYSNGLVIVTGEYAIGGSDSVSGNPTISISSFTGTISVPWFSSGWMRDTSTQDYRNIAAVVGVGGTSIILVNDDGADATTPWTWASTDLIGFTAMFEPE